MFQVYSNEKCDVRGSLVRDLRALGVPPAEAADRAEAAVSDYNLTTPADCARALGLDPRGYRNWHR